MTQSPNPAESSSDFGSIPLALADLVRQIAQEAMGGRNLLLQGPPGISKALLARRIPGLLDLTDRTRALLGAEYSVMGLMPCADFGEVWRGAPPFRAPHYTVSAAAMTGATVRKHRITCPQSGAGDNYAPAQAWPSKMRVRIRYANARPCDCDRGDRVFRPGELHLARGGVLFLDEIGEFARQTADAIAATWRTMAPETRPLLVCSTDMCPCRWTGALGRACECTDAARIRYTERIDRVCAALEIAQRFTVPLIPLADLRSGARCPSTADLRCETQAAEAAHQLHGSVS